MKLGGAALGWWSGRVKLGESRELNQCSRRAGRGEGGGDAPDQAGGCGIGLGWVDDDELAGACKEVVAEVTSWGFGWGILWIADPPAR